MTQAQRVSAADRVTDEHRAYLHGIYHRLHEHPELSMQEHRTAELVAAELTSFGIEPIRCGGTGVVGVLRNGEGPTVAFRADIDGLPIAEGTGPPYASTATGTLDDGTTVPVMRGCGHDAHAAALLTAARVLATDRHAWSGTVVLVFQPGEKTAAGAAAMVADGLWDKAPRPDVVYGQHVLPGLAGTVSSTHGHPMTQADSSILSTFPPNSNDPAATDGLAAALREEFGADLVAGSPAMAAEDFGHLSAAIGVPSVYWFFGAFTPETLASGDVPVNHSPRFAPVLEPALSTGTRAALAAILSRVGDGAGGPDRPGGRATAAGAGRP